MPGPFCRLLICATPLLVVVGCAEGSDNGPLPVYQGATNHSGPAHPDPSVDNDQISTPATSRNAVTNFSPDTIAPADVPSAEPSFRDYAAYSFTDRTGRQWLSQMLLNMDGAAYSQRFCPIHDVLGTLWDKCEAWDIGIQTADLGIGVHFISGLGTFVFRDTSDTQILAQTAFTAHGDERLGRTCPILDKRPVLEQCSAWKKLAALSSDLGIDGVAVFRGDDTYAFVDLNNVSVFAQRVLSIDGSQSWHRSCSSTGMLFDGAKGCEWSSATSITNLDLYGATRLSGWGAHVYLNNAHQVFSETAISEDGTKSARRECLFGNRAVDARTCSPWSYRSLGNVLSQNQTVL